MTFRIKIDLDCLMVKIENITNIYRIPEQNRSARIFHALQSTSKNRVHQHTKPRFEVIFPPNIIPEDYISQRVGNYNPMELKFASDPVKDLEVKVLISQLYDECGKYMEYSELAKIDTAISLMHYGHQNQTRFEGSPYVDHLLKVALPLAKKYQMDWETISSALTHDLLEDSDKNGYPVTKLDLEKLLSPVVADTVENLSKVRFGQEMREEYIDRVTRAELFKSLRDNPRAAVIKIYDRLHNLETIEFVSEYKNRELKAIETLRYYVPLANFLGLYAEAQELASLALKVLNPDLTEKIEAIREQYNQLIEEKDPETNKNYLDEVTEKIARILGRHPKYIHIYVSDIYSIYKNLETGSNPSIKHCFLRVDLETRSKDNWLDYAWLSRLHLLTDEAKDFYAEETLYPEAIREKISANRLNSLEFFMNSGFGLKSQIKFNYYPSGGSKISQIPITDLYYRKTAESGGLISDPDILRRHDNGHSKWEQIRLNIGSGIEEMEASEISQRFDRLDPFKREVIDDKFRTWYVDAGSTVLDFAVYIAWDPQSGSTRELRNLGPFIVNGEKVNPDYELQPRDEVNIGISKKRTIHPNWIKALRTSPDEVKQAIRGYYRIRLTRQFSEEAKEVLLKEAVRELERNMNQKLVVSINRSSLVAQLNRGEELLTEIALDEVDENVIKQIARELAEYQNENVFIANFSFFRDSKGLDAKVSGMISGEGINIKRQAGIGPITEGGPARLIYVIDLTDSLHQKHGKEEIIKAINKIKNKLVKNEKIQFSHVSVQSMSELGSGSLDLMDLP